MPWMWCSGRVWRMRSSGRHSQEEQSPATWAFRLLWVCRAPGVQQHSCSTLSMRAVSMDRRLFEGHREAYGMPSNDDHLLAGLWYQRCR